MTSLELIHARVSTQLRELCLRRVRESRHALLTKHRKDSNHDGLQVHLCLVAPCATASTL